MTDKMERERSSLAIFALDCLCSDDREKIEDLSLDLSLKLDGINLVDSLVLLHKIARHMQPKKSNGRGNGVRL